MGDPLLQLGPVEEAVAEQAAKQTAKLVVIEGGKRAAAGAGEALAAETAAAGVGATLLAVAGALLVLLWPSPIASELPVPRPTAGPSTLPPPVPQSDPKTVEECPERKGCPPHNWIINSPDKSPDETIKDRLSLAKNVKDQKSARGYGFEAAAIEENKKHGIEATDREYKCTKCGAIQEVDVVFKDGQLAECKSKNAKQMASKKVKRQAENYVDIQRQINELKKTTHQPLAKLDNSADLKNTVDQNGRTSREIMTKRGYEIELLPLD